MSNNNSLTTNSLIPANAVEVFEDTDRYKCRFNVRSASSNRLYRISYDNATHYWTCSCRGNIRHGQCKHLTAAGLKGRKYGKTFLPESPKQLNAPTLQIESL